MLFMPALSLCWSLQCLLTGPFMGKSSKKKTTTMSTGAVRRPINSSAQPAPCSSTVPALGASYQSLELGYDTLFAQERGRFYFNGVGTNTSLELDLELTGRARRENEQANPDERLQQQVTRELEEDDFAVKDAFVQYNFSDNLQFTTGRRADRMGAI